MPEVPTSIVQSRVLEKLVPADSTAEKQAEERKAGFDMVALLARETIQASLARPEGAEPLQNQAEQSLSNLGFMLNVPKTDSCPAEPIIHFNENRTLGEGEPRMCMRMVDGQLIPLFDKRSAGDVDPSSLKQGQWQLQELQGRTAEGFWFGCVNSKGEQRNFVLDEQTVTELYMVAQGGIMEKALVTADGDVDDEKVDTLSPKSALRQAPVQRVLTQMLANTHDFADVPDEDHNVLDGLSRDELKVAIEKTGISTDVVVKFAEKMKSRIASDAWEGSADDKKKYGDAIDKIKSDLENGLEPTAEQIQQLLTMGARPELDNKNKTLQEQINTIDTQLVGKTNADEVKKLKEQKYHLVNQQKNIHDFQAGGPDSLYRKYLDEALIGKVDPSDKDWLQQQLANASDPSAILGQLELDDPDHLAGKAFKHFTKDLPTDPTERIAWLSKFLSEHGSDILMMLLFSAVQTAGTVFADAVKGA